MERGREMERERGGAWREGERDMEREREPGCAHFLSSAHREESTREVIFQECQELHRHRDIPSPRGLEGEERQHRRTRGTEGRRM